MPTPQTESRICEDVSTTRFRDTCESANDTLSYAAPFQHDDSTMPQTPDPKTRRQIKVVGAGTNPTVRPNDACPISDQDIVHRLDAAIAQSPSLNHLLDQLAHLIRQQSDCLSLWVRQANTLGELAQPKNLIDRENDLWPLIEEQADRMIKRATQTRKICSSSIVATSPDTIVVTPVSAGTPLEQNNPLALVLVACFSVQQQSLLRVQWLMGMVSVTIDRWFQAQQQSLSQQESKGTRDAIELIQSLDQSNSTAEAALMVTNHLRRLCRADQVAISLRDSSNVPHLISISDVERIDSNCDSAKVIGNATRQAFCSNSMIQYPSGDPPSPARLALEKHCKANGVESCLNIPLTTENGRTIGAVLISAPARTTSDEDYRSYVGNLTRLVSGHLDVVMRANRGTRDVMRASWQRVWNANWTRVLVASAVCLMATLFIPAPYRVACDCELQPVMRRYVAAPYQGILEQTLVESGDVIESGEVVARLDGRQLRIELSAIRAELDGARKRRASALAQGNVADSQIAKSEMKRFESNMEIIEQNLLNLEIRSPIDGIVVSGDLDKVEGAPVEMGQTLYEIAPLNQMRSEIGIPESEIQYVKPGMKVALKLNAFPFETWNGIIARIHPSAEMVDDRWVFIAEVDLDNTNQRLRPGMKGTAKIQSNSAPIGWNLFHKSWESVRYWTIW